MEREPLSKSNEDYLEAIVELAQENENVKSVDIANKMDVTKASVNKAVTTLKDAGYIEQSRYGRVTLTDEGREYGESVLERHLMLKSFLMEQLGVEEETAEFEACEMEHAISEDTMQRWVAYLESCGGCHFDESQLGEKK